MPKLLIIFPATGRGGAEEYALHVARHAAKNGLTVTAAFPLVENVASLTEDFNLENIPCLDIRVGPAAKIFGCKPLGLVSIVRYGQAIRCLARAKPDTILLVLPSPFICISVRVIAALRKIPLTICFQLVPKKNPTLGRFAKRLHRYLHAHNETWIAVSQFGCNWLAQTFDVPADSIHVIPNAALTDPTEDPTTARNACRSELDLAPDEKIVLTVARLGIQKGHDLLIPSLPKLCHDYPNVHFVWIGDGEFRPKYTAHLKKEGLQKQVHLLGYRNDVPKWLAAADLFLFPTHYEGMPQALLEALVAGTPIIATAVSSIPEIIQHEENGLLHTANDPIDLDKKIRQALDHPKEMQRMANHALKNKATYYNQQRMLKQTLQTIHNTLPTKEKNNVKKL